MKKRKLSAAVLLILILFSLCACDGTPAMTWKEARIAQGKNVLEVPYREGEIFLNDPHFEFSFVSVTADDDYLKTGDHFVELVMSVANHSAELVAVEAENALLNDQYRLVGDVEFPQPGESRDFRVYFRGLETSELKSIVFDLSVCRRVETTSENGHRWSRSNEVLNCPVIVLFSGESE